MVLGSPFVTFREKGLKLFINDSVYKVLNIFFDVADCCFPIGKFTSADVAKAYQVSLINLMLCGVLFITFSQKAYKSLHKR